MKQLLLRKTLTGDWEQFSFNGKARFFFVKNFTDDDILVSFESETAEENCFKIKAGVGEEVTISYNSIDRNEFYVDSIYVKGTGEVEVQALDAWEA